MDKTSIIELKKVTIKKPVLVEGLPGIGLVGKLAADHLIKSSKAERIADVISPHFPHQVIMQKNGVMRMLKNRIYLIPGKKNDVLVLVGDVQAITSEAQYEVCGAILDWFEKKGGKTVITLGGYGTGKSPTTRRVFGSASHKTLISEYSKHGIVFGESRGSIIGVAGLLLGLGKLRGMNGACLMGETHGAYVDPKSAQAVLEALSKVLDMKIDISKIEERAKKGEQFMKHMERQAQKATEGALPEKNELSYIR
jgi:uncharacterized protein (TIGR00162 family)